MPWLSGVTNAPCLPQKASLRTLHFIQKYFLKTIKIASISTIFSKFSLEFHRFRPLRNCIFYNNCFSNLQAPSLASTAPRTKGRGRRKNWRTKFSSNYSAIFVQHFVQNSKFRSKFHQISIFSSTQFNLDFELGRRRPSRNRQL